LLSIVSGRDVLAGIESATADKVVTLLSSMGFAPTNAAHLPMVFIATWLLFITSLKPLQLFIGFPLYVILAPLAFVVVTVFHKFWKGVREKSRVEPLQVSIPKRRFPLASLTIVLIFGWLLLYGDSSAPGPNMVACVVSGVLFVTLTYRSLGKISPIDERDMALLMLRATLGQQNILKALQGAVEKPPKNRREVASRLRSTRLAMSLFRRIRVVFRGRRGKDRIAMLMLGEYILFFLLLAASAILFWAFALKAAVTPEQALPLATALTISASHFLPSISTSSPISLPWWLQFGPALTSWVLFVLYIGPVSSALPVRQEDFMNRLKPIRNDFTIVVKLWYIYRRFMRKLDKAYMKEEVASAKNR
jgi:uncharacterized membrane protein YhdT